jgi:hypothetical protein
VRPALDKVFEVKPGADKPPYEVECHGEVCKITVDHEIAPSKWTSELQSNADVRALSRGFSFGPDGTYMQLDDAKYAAGKKTMARIATAVHDSPAIAACKKTRRTGRRRSRSRSMRRCDA